MTKLKWDQTGERLYETGVDHAVLYKQDNVGAYALGLPWNGITTITESPSGAEATPMYADNIKYLNLIADEQFNGTIEAMMYPEAFEECDGTASVVPGVTVGQQSRRTFGLSYRTRVGNDVMGTDFGYKLHLVYGAVAAPSEKAHATMNESPEAITFSWAISTTPVDAPGFRPTATLAFDSTKVDGAALASLETILYGTDGVDARLPLPEEVFALFTGTVTQVTPTQPAFAANVITVPVVAGVVYKVDGKAVSGTVTITKDTVVTAVPAPGNTFPAVTDDDWFYKFV